MRVPVTLGVVSKSVSYILVKFWNKRSREKGSGVLSGPDFVGNLSA